MCFPRTVWYLLIDYLEGHSQMISSASSSVPQALSACREPITLWGSSPRSSLLQPGPQPLSSHVPCPRARLLMQGVIKSNIQQKSHPYLKPKQILFKIIAPNEKNKISNWICMLRIRRSKPSHHTEVFCDGEKIYITSNNLSNRKQIPKFLQFLVILQITDFSLLSFLKIGQLGIKKLGKL